ncbi:polysaccharide biosynthesis/export family protein [Pedobacter montanisoli]|uniref:Polysaccharide biosynthesis/export family protein n=1 Tax=Pedobacter montanisoli TaxID=2923277 RepID=A0ABS9ZVX7_9SPHI|nr:polysaccharide biosynthesis/export family protein [Pedobacter montanisoli]MCJ0742457.1 polysaccharide biosynthesis/export family protein [Pedobacter montanisoli]
MIHNRLLRRIFIVNLFCLFFLSSCSFKNRLAILKTPFDADTIKNVMVVNDHNETETIYNLIKPEDELAIRNYQNMDLITKPLTGTTNAYQGNYITYKVNQNGEVSMPKIGWIKVAGLTRNQAAKLIQQAYEKDELNAPLIDVRIVNAYIVLLGEVGKQGKYIIDREDYELIDLLGDAGGLLPSANRKMVRIFRGSRENPEIILVNLNDYDFIKNPKLKLKAKDIVYVEPRSAFANSQNLQSYNLFIQTGLIVINTLLIIYNLAK